MIMNSHNRIPTTLRLCAVGLFACLNLTGGPLTWAAQKPNILIIFTDDQGYGDLACYGNKKNKTGDEKLGHGGGAQGAFSFICI